MIAVPTLHPAFLLRSSEGSHGEARFRDTVVADLRKALQLRHRAPNWEESVIWQRDYQNRLVNLFPSVEDVYNFCRHSAGTTVAVDVETTGEQALDCQLICVGMASANGRAICVPLLQQYGHPYWTSGDERRVQELLGAFLGHGATPKVMHNGAFDSLVLWAHGLPIQGWTDDTMLAHHVIDGELPHGLAYVSSRFLELPYWKDDVKGDLRWLELPDEVLRAYNLRDNLTTLRLLPILLEEVRRWQLERLYRQELALAQEMAGATIRGIEVDFQRRDDPTLDTRKTLEGKPGETKPNKDYGYPLGLGPKLRMREEEALQQLRRISKNDGFKPGSPTQLRPMLFEQLQFPVVKRTRKGAPSTDKEAMMLLGLHAESPDQIDFLKNLVKWKKNNKMRTTWVEGLPILSDNRFHPTWKLLTVSGRLASSPNAQNWNSVIKRIFKAGEGMKFVSIDLSQAELRGIAYYSGDEDLLLAYQKNLNVHTINATLLFHVRNPGEDTNPQTEAYLAEAVPRSLGVSYDTFPTAPVKQWKKIRRMAKNFVFGDNYGAIADTIYGILRAERDQETDEQLFPDLTLGETEALKLQWEGLHPDIPRYWDSIHNHVTKQGHFREPLSGRIRFYRAGFKKNEIVNFPIQSLVAAWMNESVLIITKALRELFGGIGGIVLQVHDSIVLEVPIRYVAECKKILMNVLNRPFDLMTPIGRSYKGAVLPADAPTEGFYLDEV